MIWDEVLPIKVIKGVSAPNDGIDAVFQFDHWYFAANQTALKVGSAGLSRIVGVANKPLGVVTAVLAQAIGIAADDYKPEVTSTLGADFKASWVMTYPGHPEAECVWLDKDGIEIGRPPTTLMDKYVFTSPRLVVEYNIKGYTGATYDTGGKSGD